jgi:hypothetical protein
MLTLRPMSMAISTSLITSVPPSRPTTRPPTLLLRLSDPPSLFSEVPTTSHTALTELTRQTSIAVLHRYPQVSVLDVRPEIAHNVRRVALFQNHNLALERRHVAVPTMCTVKPSSSSELIRAVCSTNGMPPNLSAGKILTATSCPVRTSVARYTDPNDPSPIFSCSSRTLQRPRSQSGGQEHR